jgi:hypothetical protein
VTHEFVTARYRATAAAEYPISFTASQDNTRRASFEFGPATPGAKFARVDPMNLANIVCQRSQIHLSGWQPQVLPAKTVHLVENLTHEITVAQYPLV